MSNRGNLEPLTSLARDRVAPEVLLASVLNDEPDISIRAGKALVREAKKYGLSLKDFLRLKVDPKRSEDAQVREQYSDLNGYEATLCHLGLPVRDDFDNGVVLDLASDTFNTFPGTRSLFPEVIDDMVQWAYRQDQLENTGAIVSNSRTIQGNELITTVVNDSQSADQNATVIAEMANIPVKAIRSTEKSVKMWKIGGGYRTSYEFSRRARLDLLTPYVARTNRELERSKVAAATDILVNGDGVHSAAAVVSQASFDGAAGVTSTSGKISWENLLVWLVNRAKAGAPVDTVVGNWDAYIQWLFLFAKPVSGSNDVVAARNLAASGYQIGGVPLLQGSVNFALSSDAPAGKLIGLTKAETVEELVEANSLIDEEERAPSNQTITYYKTENSGYRLVFGDTRQIYNYAP